MRETVAVRTLALGRQAAILDLIADEALALTAEICRCRESAAGATWSETRLHALGQLEQFQRRLRSIGLRHAELAGRSLTSRRAAHEPPTGGSSPPGTP